MGKTCWKHSDFDIEKKTKLSKTQTKTTDILLIQKKHLRLRVT